MITVVPQSLDRLGEAERPTGSVVGTIKNLVQCGRVRLPHQQAEQILLKRLVSPRRALPQHRVRLFWYPFDLDTRHGAILAPLAPKCKPC
jgi:hypothetical protein